VDSSKVVSFDVENQAKCEDQHYLKEDIAKSKG
jgi:hypothetical protein